MESLFRLLPKLLNEFDDSEDVREAVVFAAWRKIAGESLSARTAPLELADKRLIVAVRDKTWKRHLESLAGQMIFKLNSALGRAVVTFIEFQIDENAIKDPLSDSAQMSKEKRRELALEELSPSLRLSAKAIADEDLRDQFLLAAGSCLARKKRKAS